MQEKRKVHTLQEALDRERKKGNTIGFVPTMGALHAGHISLIEACQDNSDISVCSIFVNPTQFNEEDDLKKYPRTKSKDMHLLKTANTDYVFYPRPEVIYPPGLDTSVDIDLKGLDDLMEGEHRPGHFAGVVQVVKRLLDIVQPDHLYMGQKDFQQFTIINYMLATLQIPTTLVVCPIKREENGLAMSSRNERLSDKIRKEAGMIYHTLLALKEKINNTHPSKMEQWALQQMDIPGFRPEYVAIVDGYNLQPIIDPEKHDYIVACTAVWAGNVRLIDNVILRK